MEKKKELVEQSSVAKSGQYSRRRGTDHSQLDLNEQGSNFSWVPDRRNDGSDADVVPFQPRFLPAGAHLRSLSAPAPTRSSWKSPVQSGLAFR